MSGKTVPPGFFDRYTHYSFMEKFKSLSAENQAKVEAFVNSLNDAEADVPPKMASGEKP